MITAGRRTRPAAVRLVAASALMLALGALLVAVRPAAAATPPRLAVRSAILVAGDTGQQLYGDQPDSEVAIASTTKLMTALVTLEHVRDLDTTFTQNDYYASSVDSQIGLVPGERMSVHDLLLALMLPSADDAAEDLAYNVGHHSVARFVAMMNAQAQALGLSRTHYTTPSGLDTPGNHSSAADLVKLAAYDMTRYPVFARIVALTHATLRTGGHVRYVVNRNTLEDRYRWIDGVKTGHTADAGYVLVASGHRHGMWLLSAVLGTSSTTERDANTLALLDYGFGSFRLAQPVRAGMVLARPTIRYRSGQRATLIAASSVRRVIPRDAAVRVVIHAPRELAGPIARHTVEGYATILVGRSPVTRTALILARALPAVSVLTVAAHFLARGSSEIGVVLVVVLVVALAFALRQRRRARAAGGGLEAA